MGIKGTSDGRSGPQHTEVSDKSWPKRSGGRALAEPLTFPRFRIRSRDADDAIVFVTKFTQHHVKRSLGFLFEPPFFARPLR